MSVNKVILVGRLGQNPELRYTPSGASVASFSIATNENWMDKGGQKQERTEWHRIVAWGKIAELCNQYLSKGRQVYIEGRLQTRQWKDKNEQVRYTTEIQAQTVQFLGGGPASAQAGSEAPGLPGGTESASAGASASAAAGGGSFAGGGDSPFTEEDIPF